MDHSEQLNELAAALSKAQAKIEDAKKDRENPHFRSPYSTLGSIWDACKPALTENGLSVVQTCEPTETGVLLNLTTTLLHSSGQFISGTMTIPLAKHDPQGYGSALTYGRRYGLAAIVGVCPDDDDGNGASHSTPPVARTAAQGVKGKWNGPEPNCPACNAPIGAPHGSKCSGGE